jgi:hypothetical protein
VTTEKKNPWKKLDFDALMGDGLRKALDNTPPEKREDARQTLHSMMDEYEKAPDKVMMRTSTALLMIASRELDTGNVADVIGYALIIAKYEWMADFAEEILKKAEETGAPADIVMSTNAIMLIAERDKYITPLTTAMRALADQMMELQKKSEAAE